MATGHWVNLKAADGFEAPAWVTLPEGTPKGALVVLQEIFGVNSHIRSVAERWAERGYATVAPSTFARVQPHVELGYSGDDMKTGFGYKMQTDGLPNGGVLQDVQAAIDHAAQLAGGGKVGIFGFCWGGLVTWRAASQLQGLSAAVTYYGGGMTAPDEVARKPLCPVMSHFGERDHFIPLDGVQAFAKAHPDVPVHVYAADHGFNCDQRGSWDAPAAALADARTQAFFAQHIG